MLESLKRGETVVLPPSVVSLSSARREQSPHVHSKAHRSLEEWACTRGQQDRQSAFSALSVAARASSLAEIGGDCWVVRGTKKARARVLEGIANGHVRLDTPRTSTFLLNTPKRSATRSFSLQTTVFFIAWIGSITTYCTAKIPGFAVDDL